MGALLQQVRRLLLQLAGAPVRGGVRWGNAAICTLPIVSTCSETYARAVQSCESELFYIDVLLRVCPSIRPVLSVSSHTLAGVSVREKDPVLCRSALALLSVIPLRDTDRDNCFSFGLQAVHERQIDLVLFDEDVEQVAEIPHTNTALPRRLEIAPNCL